MLPVLTLSLELSFPSSSSDMSILDMIRKLQFLIINLLFKSPHHLVYVCIIKDYPASVQLFMVAV